MRQKAIALFLVVIISAGPLTVEKLHMGMRLYPLHDPLSIEVNAAWDRFDEQDVPTPKVAEGMFTLYGYSEAAWGVVDLRARDYEQQRSYGAEINAWGEELVYLRGEGVDGFRERLWSLGYDCVIALKGDEIGRVGTVSFLDVSLNQWTEPLWVIVLDGASSPTWQRLRLMANPLDGVMRRWVAEPAKDCLEQAGLSDLVERNHSGFVHLVLDEAVRRSIDWN